MQCEHKPNISIFMIIFGRKDSCNCVLCNKKIEPMPICNILSGIILVILLIAGVILLIFINKLYIIPVLALTEGVVFWISQIIIYKYGPYRLSEDVKK